MGAVADRLLSAGLALPAAPAALGAYLPAVRAGALVFTAGQLPLADGEVLAAGHVDDEVPLEQAGECARVCALNALAAAGTVCDLESVNRVVKLVVYVASARGFTAQPRIADFASEVLVTAFGEKGRHAREAVGVAELPRGAPVEVSLILEVCE